MRTVLCSRVWPSVVYKSCDGKPHIPIILPGQGEEAKILLHPLILSLCKSIGLGVECSADVSSYAQLSGQHSHKVQGKVRVPV